MVNFPVGDHLMHLLTFSGAILSFGRLLRQSRCYLLLSEIKTQPISKNKVLKEHKIKKTYLKWLKMK